jgi:hypothetical protein
MEAGDRIAGSAGASPCPGVESFGLKLFDLGTPEPDEVIAVHRP